MVMISSEDKTKCELVAGTLAGAAIDPREDGRGVPNNIKYTP